MGGERKRKEMGRIGSYESRIGEGVAKAVFSSAWKSILFKEGMVIGCGNFLMI